MALGLKEYKARQAQEEARREEASKPRVQRFALEKDGDSAVVRFAQEIDPDAKNYDSESGIGVVHIFHVNGDDPKNGFKNSAKCTKESQGACLPCEKVTDYGVEWEQRKGWKQKEKFCINLIAGEPREVTVREGGQDKKKYYTTDLPDDEKGGTVYLLEQSTYNGIYDALAAFFMNEKASKDTILEKTFQITRKGNNYNDTSYSVIPVADLSPDATPLSEFELVDVEEVLPEPDYKAQEAFYYRGISVAAENGGGRAQEASAGSSDTGTEDTW